MNVKSVFGNNKNIPQRFTCEGRNVNPPLDVSGIEDGVKTLALVVDDPDAPGGTFVHWVVYNISVNGPNLKIPENAFNKYEGVNSAGKKRYVGPCPPSGKHRYFFKVYALDSELHIKGKATKEKLEKAMKDSIVDHAELVGLYERENIK